ncbi:hypothetical protein [Rhizobium mongolense]|uniref:Lysozyme family protein n=2 Tax=Rhizobium mongolense TaxID=57676 RepID=A0ABR6IN71_9HYPH|nr:hypothetical protein [Rhizobium mongolense]MBB4229337.1 lysozyme family protein [Rhizobium mongolense]TVZ63119.1 lysozyme family protein [Rhizobium mongolense USDA 1844]
MSEKQGAPASDGDFDVGQLELSVRREEAKAKLAELKHTAAKASNPPATTPWFKPDQVTVLLIGGILTLAGNIGLASYNARTALSQESLKAQLAIDVEREKAKANLILQAIASSDAQISNRNIMFFVEGGLIPDADGSLRKAAQKYLPVLPSSGATPAAVISPSEYERAFWLVTLNQDALSSIDAAVDRIQAARDRFVLVGNAINTPWYVVGIIWWMESGGSFNVHLINGDPLAARTVNAPMGHPAGGKPPFTWEESAIDGLKNSRLQNLNSANIASVLTAIERYNGTGYQRRGVSSPYLWSFTSGYTKGSYIADSLFDSNAVSKQIGAVALLRRMHERGLIELDTSDNSDAAPQAQ